jgi:putative ABC transport system ATP-binding protein
MSPAMPTIVSLEGISKTYGAGALAVSALRGIDLEIGPGELTAVAGPSGSGKSTLLNIVGGLDRPTRGQVVVAGQDITNLSGAGASHLRLEKIGFVFQAYNLLPVLTAYENAEYVLMLRGVPPAKRHDPVMAVLARVGLTGLEHRFPRQLSGGQQQRVAIARAIVTEPALVLADEPTANLDSKTGAALLDLIEELNREKGITFLFSSHDRNVLARARRLLVLTDGALSYDGPPSGSGFV